MYEWIRGHNYNPSRGCSVAVQGLRSVLGNWSRAAAGLAPSPRLAQPSARPSVVYGKLLDWIRSTFFPVQLQNEPQTTHVFKNDFNV